MNQVPVVETNRDGLGLPEEGPRAVRGLDESAQGAAQSQPPRTRPSSLRESQRTTIPKHCEPLGVGQDRSGAPVVTPPADPGYT